MTELTEEENAWVESIKSAIWRLENDTFTEVPSDLSEDELFEWFMSS